MKIKLAGREISLPQSRILRIGLGVLLIFCGFLGFLPVLGFWMVPLGIYILSLDFPVVRRRQRKFIIWWGRNVVPSWRQFTTRLKSLFSQNKSS